MHSLLETYRRLPKKDQGYVKRIIIIAITLSLVVASITTFVYQMIWTTALSFFVTIIVVVAGTYGRNELIRRARIARIETIFPDFLQLIASNLRAGMTIDRSILLSARAEFAPLDKEVLKAGREITTGKSVALALLAMAQRINSDKIEKVIILINSGIRAGGNLSILLDETSRNMREREIVERKASSAVLMYVIFIFLIVAIFAPALFALSTVLVEVLTSVLEGVPEIDASVNLPFTLSKISISTTFVMYFSLLFIIVIDILASLVLGLVSKGEEKEGMKYIPVMIVLSVTIFFITRIIVGNVVGGFF